MKVLVCGIGGKMGKMLIDILANDNDATLVAGVDLFIDPSKFDIPVFKTIQDVNVDFDVIIDFSRPEALSSLLSYIKDKKIPAVLCTTGYTKEQEEEIYNTSKFAPIFRSSNMSVGVNVLINLCKNAAKVLADDFEVEIIEQHHNLKVDAPSGTALSIANAINEEYDNSKNFVYGRCSKNQKREKSEIGIHAIRGGTIVGKHDVLFIGQDEIVTIAHEAQSKAVFAKGAIKAAKFLMSVKTPKIYNMQDLVNQII